MRDWLHETEVGTACALWRLAARNEIGQNPRLPHHKGGTVVYAHSYHAIARLLLPSMLDFHNFYTPNFCSQATPISPSCWSRACF